MTDSGTYKMENARVKYRSTDLKLLLDSVPKKSIYSLNNSNVSRVCLSTGISRLARNTNLPKDVLECLFCSP